MQKFSQLYSQIVLKRRDNDETYRHSTKFVTIRFVFLKEDPQLQT